MQRRCRRDAGFASLAGNIDPHAEPVTEPAGIIKGAQAAELDCLQADARRGAACMMLLDVVKRMNALVGADRNICCRGDTRHAVEIFRTHRLLEKIKAAIGKPRDVTQRFVDAEALRYVAGLAD